MRKFLSPPEGLRFAYAYAMTSLLGLLGLTAASAWFDLHWTSLIAWTSLQPDPFFLGPRNISGLLSYSVVPVSLENWLSNAVTVLLYSYLLRREYSDLEQLQLAAAGAIVGGLSFLLSSVAQAPLVGGGMVSWAFAGAFVFYGLTHWRDVGWFWKLMVGLTGIGMVNLILVGNPRIPLSLAVTSGAILAAFWSRRKSDPSITLLQFVRSNPSK